MKRIQCGLAAGVLLTAAASWPSDAQTPVPLDARASDPVRMGWMTGSPPPPDKLVRFADSAQASCVRERSGSVPFRVTRR